MSFSSFKPAWWLPGPHLQTLWPTLCRKSPKGIALVRERFELPDGDFLDLAWAGKTGPIVLILHGLEGSVQSTYAQGMLSTLVKNGWRGLFMHFRGCSGEPNRLPRGYHSGETQDLTCLVQALLRREPRVPLAAIGFSLGGNVLLKWLGETGKNNPLRAATAVSVPFELNKIPEPAELPEQVYLELTASGGHVGFVAGNFPWRSEYWLEQRVPAFLKDYLG